MHKLSDTIERKFIDSFDLNDKWDLFFTKLADWVTNLTLVKTLNYEKEISKNSEKSFWMIKKIDIFL
jgi:uncharacterized UPF0160 family protein